MFQGPFNSKTPWWSPHKEDPLMLGCSTTSWPSVFKVCSQELRWFLGISKNIRFSYHLLVMFDLSPFKIRWSFLLITEIPPCERRRRTSSQGSPPPIWTWVCWWCHLYSSPKADKPLLFRKEALEADRGQSGTATGNMDVLLNSTIVKSDKCKVARHWSAYWRAVNYWSRYVYGDPSKITLIFFN